MTPEAQSQLVPVGWILAAAVSTLATILIAAWRGFVWLRTQIREVSDESNRVALRSSEHRAFIADIVTAAFTNHAESEHLWRQDVIGQIRDLRTRADGQAASIAEAHRRIDKLLESRS